MMKRVKIEVTKSHIRRGVQGDVTKCMLALAIREHLKPDLVAVVHGKVEIHGTLKSGIYWTMPETRVVQLPKKAVKAMSFYDLHPKSASKPMSFSMGLPVEVLRAPKKKDFVDEVVAERTRKNPGFRKLVKKAIRKKK